MFRLSGKPRRLPVRALRWISSASFCGALTISSWTSYPLAADGLSPVRLRPVAAVKIAPSPEREQDAAPVRQDNTPRIEAEPTSPAELPAELSTEIFTPNVLRAIEASAEAENPEDQEPEDQPLRPVQERPADPQFIPSSSKQPTRFDSSPQPSPRVISRSAFGQPGQHREAGPAALPTTPSQGRGLLQKLFASPTAPPAAIASPADDSRDRDGQDVVNALFHREAARRSRDAFEQRDAGQKRSAGPVRFSFSDREIRRAEADQDRGTRQDVPRSPAGARAAGAPLSALNAHSGPLPPYRMKFDRRAEATSKRGEN